MPAPVISIENISKAYRLGAISSRTLRDDVARWWAQLRGQPDPTLQVGQTAPQPLADQTLWALREVSFAVQQGEVLGIIGRNGAGKSTLLKILSRVTAPTSGQIKVRGRIASLLEVGTGFNPELTGRENIYLNGALLGMKRHEITRKFAEIVDFSGVAEFIDTPVKRYSSGMYVRLAFAVAAHLEPEILIVDEVLAVGDAAFQKKCLGKMGEVAQGGRTVLFVSHNLAAVAGLCPQGVVLEQGRIIFAGPSAEAIPIYLQSTQTHANQNLAQRADIKGNQTLQLQQIRVFNREQNEQQQVASGQALSLGLTYTTQAPLKNLAVALTLYNSMGQATLTCWTEYTNSTFATVPTSGEILCHIPRLPLIPGLYTLAVSLRDTVNVLYQLENAHTLEVVEGDFFGTGKAPKRTVGVCLADHHWECRAALQ